MEHQGEPSCILGQAEGGAEREWENPMNKSGQAAVRALRHPPPRFFFPRKDPAVPTLRHLLSATLATSLLLTSATAEARFGKRSTSDSSSSDDKEEKKEKKERRESRHEATPVGSSDSGSSRRHEATPVDSRDDDDSESGSGSSYSGGSGSSYSGSTRRVTVVAVSHDHTPVYPYAYTPRVEQQAEPRSPIMVRMGLEGQAMGGGSAFVLNLGLEGKRWGVGGAMTGLTLPTDDGTEGEDTLQLYSAHLTYAVYSSDHGRLRLEGGVAMAKAPDVTFIGPSIAASFERCLVGALDLEGRAQLVPVPYTQLDAQAGMALHMGVLTVRGGWRWLLLNDRGVVDGETHEDVFAGPYAGIGLAF